MPAGKPFAKPTDAQRALFGAQLKQEGVQILGRFGRALLQETGSFLHENPDSIITHTVQHPFIKMAIVTAAQGLADLQAERADKADAEVAKAAASAAKAPKAPDVVDAEIVDDEPAPEKP